MEGLEVALETGGVCTRVRRVLDTGLQFLKRISTLPASDRDAMSD